MGNFVPETGAKKKMFEEIAAEDFSDMVTHIKLQNTKLIKSKERYM